MPAVVTYNVMWGHVLNVDQVLCLYDFLGIKRDRSLKPCQVMEVVDDKLGVDYGMCLWFGSDIYGKAEDRSWEDHVIVLGYAVLDQGDEYKFSTRKLKKILGDLFDHRSYNAVAEAVGISNKKGKYYICVDHREASCL
jgi:hypothetical protein